jgi:AcrR family transcriptional regulator
VTVKRRSSADIRAELLAAAAHLFATRGWAGTSTKEIATRANTYETSLYTHFGSKAGIFSAAVVEPFQQFIESFRVTLARDHGAPDEHLARTFVRDLYGTLEEHREAATAFILAMQDPEARDGGCGYRFRAMAALRGTRIGRGHPGRNCRALPLWHHAS